MIGQSVINIKSGASKRLSTLISGVFLLFLIIALGSVVKQIPMAALVGVMIMVAIGTFDWKSLVSLKRVPLSDSIVMIVTVSIVVVTHDLSKGVMAGVVLSAIIFAWKIAKIRVQANSESNRKVYRVHGQL